MKKKNEVVTFHTITCFCESCLACQHFISKSIFFVNLMTFCCFSIPIPTHSPRASSAHDSKESRDYVNRLIGRNLSNYFNNDPPNKYWIPQ